jgi:hypothetical protein
MRRGRRGHVISSASLVGVAILYVRRRTMSKYRPNVLRVDEIYRAVLLRRDRRMSRPVCRLDIQAASSDDDKGSQPQLNPRRYSRCIPIATEEALQRSMFKLLTRGANTWNRLALDGSGPNFENNFLPWVSLRRKDLAVYGMACDPLGLSKGANRAVFGQSVLQSPSTSGFVSELAVADRTRLASRLQSSSSKILNAF